MDRTVCCQGRIDMTRLTRLFTALGLTSVLVGAAAIACVRPGAPTEVKPVAPRPEPVDPTAMPVMGAPDVIARPDAGHGPISAVSPAMEVPVPAFSPEGQQPDAGTGGTGAPAPIDAGTPDSYTPPLPAIPDGNIPADSRLEPSRLRD
jgi:hypothetical protein